MINKNNLRENLSRLDYQYQVGDLVTIRNDYLKITKKADLANDGPHTVVAVKNNGATLRIRRDDVEELINIRRVDPYFER